MLAIVENVPYALGKTIYFAVVEWSVLQMTASFEWSISVIHACLVG